MMPVTRPQAWQGVIAAYRDHLDAVSRFGYSEAHRRSFRPPTLFDRI